MFLNTILLIIGIALLIFAANWLVDGASAIASRFGVSDLTIGLTLVALGTSMPEFMVNILASLSNSSGLAIGNVVGSNTVNILLILGMAALVRPLRVQRKTTRIEIPFALLAAIVLIVVANDTFFDGQAASVLSRSEGIVLLCFFAVFMFYIFTTAREGDSSSGGPIKTQRHIWKSIALVVFGMLGLFGGSKLVVDAAILLASALGVSDTLIGLTVVAVGTSLPELATSVVAAFKGNSDIAVGNVVGSNVFNIFFILGISSTINPLPFYASANVDLMVMGGASLFLFIFAVMGRGRLIDRREGAAFVAFYLLYLGYLIATA